MAVHSPQDERTVWEAAALESTGFQSPLPLPLPLRVADLLLLLPPRSRCCHSVTLSPWPRPWRRKTPPTGTASRWRPKPRRDRVTRARPNKPRPRLSRKSHPHLSQVPEVEVASADVEAASSFSASPGEFIFKAPKSPGWDLRGLVSDRWHLLSARPRLQTHHTLTAH